MRENFRVEPDAWQADALMAFADPTLRRISLQACAGPGKSAVLAWMGLNFLTCYGEEGDRPNGFVVAITSDNLKANLWKEFAKWHGKSALLSSHFVWTSERISRAHDKLKATWFLEARSWPKTASAEEQGKTLSGLHGGYVLALIDESGAIPKTVALAADQALSTGPKFGKIVQSGNPLSRDGMLYDASTSGDWHVISITGDPDDPKRSPRIDIEWARSKIARQGRNDPWVMAYILGKFPPTAINALLDPDEVRAAMKRVLPVHAYDHAARILGVDVAREGDDCSVIFPRQGMLASMPIVLHGATTDQGAGTTARKWAEWHADACFVDNTGGWGGGWIDQMRLLKRNPTGIHFAGKPDDPRYANKRAEMWFAMANWVKEGGALPHLPELVDELCKPVYFFKGDKFQMEDKEDIKTRLGRSPDHADALALTFAYPVQPGPDHVLQGISGVQGGAGMLWDGQAQRFVRISSGQPESHDEFGFGNPSR